MSTRARMRPRDGDPAAGFTLVELVIVVAIIGILAAAVLPLAHWSVKRQREYELQQDLRMIRIAIDRYHDLALAGLIEVPPGDTGYPPNLDVLVEGVELTGEIPAPVPGAAGEFAATGAGLTGGMAGMAGGQAGGMGGGMGGGPTPAMAGGQSGAGIATALGGRSGGVAAGQTGANARRSLLAGAAAATMGDLQNLMDRRATGGLRGGGAPGGLGARARSADRNAAGGRAPADIQKIVLLRRLPVDPFTGETDWGTRCYGDPIEDRSWCGRNVFDVYSNARGRGIDGRPYREW